MAGEAPAAEPPRPGADPLTAFFWEGCREGKLLILRCRACGHYIHPPRPVCSACLSTDLAPSEVSGRGTLYSWTVAHQAFHPWFLDKFPYVLATVTLVEQTGLQMVTNVIDCDEEDLRADAPVEVAFREVAPDLVLPQFQLVAQ